MNIAFIVLCAVAAFAAASLGIHPLIVAGFVAVAVVISVILVVISARAEKAPNCNFVRIPTKFESEL